VEYAVLIQAFNQITNVKFSDFQQTKHAYLKTARIPANSKFTQVDLDRGFLVAGLWSWSRHPNFAAEQAVWLAFYQWVSYASDSLVNWTVVGVLCYLALFQSSTKFTELITAGKYTEYKEYQQLVGMFLPSMLGGIWKGKSVVKKD
jgi:steroid 5-alpha reductase family enzyme